jgi:LacI family transcriptional regulator
MAEVTLKKLAEMLNLSISTVSRALKNHPDISEETKTKVKELAAIVDYEPNTYAINLRTNSSKEFGVIIPAISNDFYQSFISSLEEEARLYGNTLIIMQSGEDPAIELENLKRCKQNRMAGVFVSITTKTVDILNFIKLADQHIPVIFFDKVPNYEDCNKVCVDDIAAATLAAEALIAKKKKKILSIFANQKMSITQKRLKAYQETFAKYRSDAELVIQSTVSINEACELVKSKLTGNDKVDAIFCMSDEILIGTMKAIQQLDLRTPKDVGVIAISDGIIPTFYYPQITYIETSGFKLAKTAFSTMQACIAGDTDVKEIMIESVMIEGGSL